MPKDRSLPPTVTADRSLVRTEGGSTRFALVTLTAPDADPDAARRPVDVSFVLDRSGSMAGAKIELAREALTAGLRMLGPENRVSVVTFDSEVDVLVPSTLATRGAIERAVRRVERIDARSATDLAGGWLAGAHQLSSHLAPGRLGRCLLLSDGHANRGLADPAALAIRAGELRHGGIVTSTFGVGADFDERLLQGMAEAGGGNAYFVQQAVQIPDLLTSELGDALDIVADEVVVRVAAAPDVEVDTLSRFETRRAPGLTTIRLGSLTASQTVTIVLRLRFPAGREADRTAISISLEDAENRLPGASTEVTWTYAGAETVDAAPRDPLVIREVARLEAARARAEAAEHNRLGDYQLGVEALLRTSRRLTELAGDDPEVRRLAIALAAATREFGRELPPMMRKLALYDAVHAGRSRLASGKAMKGFGPRRGGPPPSDRGPAGSPAPAGVHEVPYRSVKGHLIGRWQGRFLLFDTGSPFSIGQGPVELAGRVFPTTTVPGVDLAEISAMIEQSVDTLVGMDALGRLDIEIDPDRRIVTASRVDLPLGGREVPIVDLALAVPIVEIVVDGAPLRAVLDTGAWVSYLPPSVAQRFPTCGTARDFMPGFGRFETALHDTPFELAGDRIDIPCGVLPERLRARLATTGVEAIVGTQLLEHYAVTLSCRRRAVALRARRVPAATVN